MRDERLGFRRKDELCARIGDDQRLDAEPVAAKPQRAVPRIEISEGEHAVEAGDGSVGAPMVEGLEENLGIARAAKLHALPLQAAAEFAMVVDFSVIGEDTGAVRRAHGLARGCRQVDNRKSPVTEGDASLLPQALTVGTAMRDGRQHQADRRSIRFAAIVPPDPDDSAHS
jgi:hypothetical protein